MQLDIIHKIFEIFENQNPNPKTELNFTNNFTLLIAVVLSAQATDISVNKATKNLFKIADTPEKILEIGEENLKKYISSIGLYNSKAKNIIKLCKQLIDKHNSQIPQNFKDLKNLAGVGQKTANVVLNCAFNVANIAVDTHVFRVANRIGFVKTKNPIATEKKLLKTIPKKFLSKAHHWLILHGRYICKARKPLCENCRINKFCNYVKN